MPDYPPVNFHFRVQFLGLPSGSDEDIRFQSVSGLNVHMETETLREGGENRFKHVLPTHRRYSNLVLKRGLLRPKESRLTDWCKDAFDNFIFNPIDLVVQLLNENHEPIVLWYVAHVWPKRWILGELNAEKGEVLIETFVLNYNYFELKKT